MNFTLYYASKTLMRITQVRMSSEESARKWFQQAKQWNDVVRVRITNETTGDVLADEVIAHRIEGDRADKIRELVDRMDDVFVAERQFVQRIPSPPTERKAIAASERDNEKCHCTHARLEHAGEGSNGNCMGAGCYCRRFRRAW